MPDQCRRRLGRILRSSPRRELSPSRSESASVDSRRSSPAPGQSAHTLRAFPFRSQRSSVGVTPTDIKAPFHTPDASGFNSGEREDYTTFRLSDGELISVAEIAKKLAKYTLTHHAISLIGKEKCTNETYSNIRWLTDVCELEETVRGITLTVMGKP